VPLTVYTQEDVSFPPGIFPLDDTDLEMSYRLDIEAVPALLRIEDGSYGFCEETDEPISIRRSSESRYESASGLPACARRTSTS